MARTVANLQAQDADAVLDHIGTGTQLIVPLANGEPTALLDAIEAGADRLVGVGVHQMHAIHDRPYMKGEYRDRLRHVSYFLSHITRPHFAAGGIDLVPAHFSEVFAIMRARTDDPLVIAAAWAHAERIVFEAFLTKLQNMPDGSNRQVLNLVCDLFALSAIENDRAWFLEHGRLSTARSKAITAMVNDLCRRLRPHAVDLVDAFGVPPEMLRSDELF